MNIYLTEQGLSVHKQSESLKVMRGAEEVQHYAFSRLSGLRIFGNISVTTPAFRELLQRNIPMHFFSEDGHFAGSLSCPSNKNILRRIRQYAAFSDGAVRLEFAKTFLNQKLTGSRSFIHELSYRFKSIDVKGFDLVCDQAMEKIQNSQALSSLLGFEGVVAKHYWAEYGKAQLKHKFIGRRYRPATDPVNACLSFGYSLLTREIQGLLDAQQIDPFLGFLHSVAYGRPSLALDVIEPFRNRIDRFVIRILNKGILGEEDFYESNRSLFLKTDRLRVYLRQYEEFMNKPRKQGDQSLMMSYRLQLSTAVEELRRTIDAVRLEEDEYGGE